MFQIIASKNQIDKKTLIVQIHERVYEYTYDIKKGEWEKTIPVSDRRLHEMILFQDYAKHSPPDELENQSEMYKLVEYFSPDTPEGWKRAIHDYREKMSQPITF